jgi:hypothetical protein
MQDFVKTISFLDDKFSGMPSANFIDEVFKDTMLVAHLRNKFNSYCNRYNSSKNAHRFNFIGLVDFIRSLDSDAKTLNDYLNQNL